MINLRRVRVDQENRIKSIEYQMSYFKDFDYSVLSDIKSEYRKGRGHDGECWNNIIMMGDTETSKLHPNAKDVKTGKYIAVTNYVVIWTISLRAYHHNIVTLWGRTPWEFCSCIQNIHNHMKGNRSIIYFHNLAYDYVFLRKFLFKTLGYPTQQLNTKSHNPINIEFDNGIILRDSYILAQTSLEKWCDNMNVEHKKAVGYWDYTKIRTQREKYTDDELHYAEFDTLGGVECLDALMTTLNKKIYSMPYTATGIVRNDIIELANANHYRRVFTRIAPTYEQYLKLLQAYHGGYTHANRYLIEYILSKDLIGEVKAFDFSSSYPYCMLAFKYPYERFFYLDVNIPWILEHYDTYACMFKLRMINVRLKDKFNGMPCLQYSKCTQALNAIADNGRILQADYVEIYTTEVTLKLLLEYYDCDAQVFDVEVAHKDYLPRWFTDYIFSLYRDKTTLKGTDDIINYNLKKSKINSCYGLSVQKSLKESITEDYLTGEYFTEKLADPEESYQKYLGNRRSVLPYFIGVWVTEYAMSNLFELGKCCETWCYSDTDSCYGINWDMNKVQCYNDSCKDRLRANGYECVYHNNREYWLGIAELDGEYKRAVFLGAKRYAVEDYDGQVKITVAGVPKKQGSKALQADGLEYFKKGYCFKGEDTGKLTHSYLYVDGIYKDSKGNWIGDSIDLMPCDYLLDSVEFETLNDLENEEVRLQYYE